METRKGGRGEGERKGTLERGRSRGRGDGGKGERNGGMKTDYRGRMKLFHEADVDGRTLIMTSLHSMTSLPRPTFR